MRKAIVPLGLAAAMSYVALPSARAVTARNLSTGQVIFESYGFELDVPGTPPAATGAGNWVSYHTDQVITGGTPGAFAGDNYVTTTRDNQGAGGPEAHFSSEQSVPGEHIRIEWPMWIPTTGDDALILHNSGSYYRGLGRITGGQYLNYNGAAYVPTGLTYTPGAWQTWTIDYTIGASVYQIGVGGNTVTTDALNGISAIGGGPLDGLYFGHNGNDTFFIDGAIPEPATCGMLAIIAGGALLRRRAGV